MSDKQPLRPAASNDYGSGGTDWSDLSELDFIAREKDFLETIRRRSQDD
jgi:hypothetical protein